MDAQAFNDCGKSDKWLQKQNYRLIKTSTLGSLLLQHAPATDLLLELAPSYLTSLIQWSKNFVVQQLFLHEIVGTHEGALPREHVAGACFRSKLPSAYEPLDSHSSDLFRNVLSSNQRQHWLTCD